MLEVLPQKQLLLQRKHRGLNPIQNGEGGWGGGEKKGPLPVFPCNFYKLMN